MDIIILKGSSNSGKTTTLNFLIHHLMSITSPEEVLEIQTDTLVSGIDIHKEECMKIDRKGTFIYSKTIRIGIYTSGDDLNNINNAILFFQKQKCDIGIMAVNKRLQEYWNKQNINAKEINVEHLDGRRSNIDQKIKERDDAVWEDLKKALSNLGIKIK